MKKDFIKTTRAALRSAFYLRGPSSRGGSFKETAFKKETKILFTLFCVLLVLYALTFLRKFSYTSTFSSRLIPEMDMREISEIHFSIPTRAEPVEMGEMTLVREGGRFYLRTANGAYSIRPEIIDRFFTLLCIKRSFRPIEVLPEHYPDYGLDTTHASHLVFKRQDGTILSELFFGASNTAGISQYVRLGTSIKVFLIDTDLRAFLTVAAPFWLDLQVYAALMRGTSIQGVEYGKDNVTRTEANVHSFIALEKFLEKCSCIDVYSAPRLQSPHTMSVHLSLGDGTRLQLAGTPLESGDYVFFDSRSLRTYLMSSYTFTKLMEHVRAVTEEKNSSLVQGS